MDYLALPNYRDYSEEFEPLCSTMLPLYKLAMIKKGYNSQFFDAPPSMDILKLMQDIPVNLSTVSQDLKVLHEKAENQLLDLAKQRWKIAQEIEQFLTIG